MKSYLSLHSSLIIFLNLIIFIFLLPVLSQNPISGTNQLKPEMTSPSEKKQFVVFKFDDLTETNWKTWKIVTDIEYPRFTLVKAPAWLSIDENTGLLSGTPPASKGSCDVTVSVVIENKIQVVDIPVLGWGNYKVKSTETEVLGPEVQEFRIVFK